MKKETYIHNLIDTIGDYCTDNIGAKRLASIVFKGKLFSTFSCNLKNEDEMAFSGKYKSSSEAMRAIVSNLWKVPWYLDKKDESENFDDFFDNCVTCLTQYRVFEKKDCSPIRTHAFIIINWRTEELIEVTSSNIDLYSTDPNFTEDKFLKIVDVIKSLIFSESCMEKKSTVNVIVLKSYGIDLQDATIKSTDVNLNESYNDDFKDVDERMKQFIQTRTSGIAILRGEPGTGKTTYIRHLINNNAKSYIIITNAVAARLAEPEFTSFLLDNKDSVFILEDCERILKSRDTTDFSNGIENILNMADGLMSDVFNIKFICTFNADMTTIDSALLRPGRCYVNYEFKKLCKEKSRALLEKNYGLSKDETKEVGEMTLAEIYNYDKKSLNAAMNIKSSKSKNKIGF